MDFQTTNTGGKMNKDLSTAAYMKTFNTPVHSQLDIDDILVENQSIREKLEQLRRDHNELIIENSFMKKENENYERKLKEEQKYRERYVPDYKISILCGKISYLAY